MRTLMAALTAKAAQNCRKGLEEFVVLVSKGLRSKEARFLFAFLFLGPAVPNHKNSTVPNDHQVHSSLFSNVRRGVCVHEILVRCRVQ